jgi:hypothetical protein
MTSARLSFDGKMLEYMPMTRPLRLSLRIMVVLYSNPTFKYKVDINEPLHAVFSGVAEGRRGRGGDRPPPPPNRKKNYLKKAKSVEKLGGVGVHVTSSKLKLIKNVSTEENDDILEELDLQNLVKALL